MKEHIGDIRAARATGLIEGMAKGFDMKGERRKKQDDQQKGGSQENMGDSIWSETKPMTRRKEGKVLLRSGWVDTAARPLRVCPAHKFRMGFPRVPWGRSC